MEDFSLVWFEMKKLVYNVNSKSDRMHLLQALEQDRFYDGQSYLIRTYGRSADTVRIQLKYQTDKIYRATDRSIDSIKTALK